MSVVTDGSLRRGVTVLRPDRQEDFYADFRPDRGVDLDSLGPYDVYASYHRADVAVGGYLLVVLYTLTRPDRERQPYVTKRKLVATYAPNGWHRFTQTAASRFDLLTREFEVAIPHRVSVEE